MVGIAEMSKTSKKYTAPDWSDVPSVLNPQQAADVLGLHLNTIKKLIYEGTLPHFKTGRVIKVHKVDLMRYAGLTPPDEAN